MKRQFPGLHSEAARAEDTLEGIFLVRVTELTTVGTRKNLSSFSASRSSSRRTSSHAKSQDDFIALTSRFGN
jgi:hypothetical protein